MKLIDLARVIRSKNAGPTTLTLDIMFNDEAGYERACMSEQLKPSAVALLYGVAPNDVEVIAYPPAHAIKIVMGRKVVAGTPGDRDVYGAQQHGPLLGVEL